MLLADLSARTFISAYQAMLPAQALAEYNAVRVSLLPEHEKKAMLSAFSAQFEQLKSL